MAKARKDNRGRALRKGESQRKSDNMYIYVYVDPFGKRRYIYSSDLVKLREREKCLLKDQLDGLDVYAAGKADLNFVFDRYISTKTDLRRTTYTNYTYMYDRFVRPEFGKKKIGEIKYSDVLYFYFHLVNEKHIQVNTLETIHTVLHPTFQLAVRDEIIRNNPSAGVMAEIKKKPGKNHGVRHALTLEQQRAFMNYTASSPVFCKWTPLFTVLLGTGCRIGEVIGLRWEDVDMEKRLIDINHSVTYYPRKTDTTKCEFGVSLPKTEAGIRVIPMMDAVYEAFREEYEYQQENGFSTVELDGMTGFIFSNRFGNLHNPQALNRTIKRISESYNAEEVLKAKKEKRQPIIIPHFSCHHLRHTFCTRFCENETNIKVIQAVMGHANIETTMDIYAEVTDIKKTEAIENLSHKLDVF
ncbi:MAG: tyrosine-type recombinase/integrase [Blautia sp.]